MAENPSVFQNLQLGVESTPGTAVPANKLLQDLKIKIDAEFESDSFTPSGRRFSSAVYPNREWVKGSIEGKPGYQTLPYLLSALLKDVTPTRNIPSTGLSYKWVYNPSVGAVDTFKTLSLESGNNVRAEKAAYGVLSGIEFKGTRKEVSISGELFAQKLNENATLTSSPTLVPAVLVLPTDGDIYYATTKAGLSGAARLGRVLEWGASLKDVYGQVWPIRTDSPSWTAPVAMEVKGEASLKAAVDAEGAAFFGYMRSGAKGWLRFEYNGATIETTYKYQLRIDVCVAVKSPDAKDDTDGLATRGWKFQIVTDDTTGDAVEMTVQNTLATL